MNHTPTNTPNDAPTGDEQFAPVDQADLSISRLLDADASAWKELESLASQDPSLWRRVAVAQWHAALVSRAADRAVESALVAFDRAPHATVVAADHDRPRARAVIEAQPQHAHDEAPRALWTGWSGWLAAAVMTFMLIGSMRGLLGPGADTQNPQSMNAGFNVQSPDDALQAYLDLGQQSGRVIGEVPELQLLERQPAPGGAGFELVYVRKIIERRVSSDVYQIGADETGAPVAFPVLAPARSTAPTDELY